MTTDSPERKALDYVEGELGVHSVYEHALMTRSELQGVLQSLLECKAERRRLESLKDDLTMALASDLRAANPSLSLAAYERELKAAVANDDEIREVRDSLATLAIAIDGMEHQEKLLEVDIRIDTARLNELGGLLQFMAVIKSISAAKQP